MNHPEITCALKPMRSPSTSVLILKTLLIASLLLFAAVTAGGCQDNHRDSEQPSESPSIASASRSPDDGPIGDLVAIAPEVTGLDFTPDGRLFFTVRQLGQIRWIDEDIPGSDRPVEGNLFAELDVFSRSECGLLGIAVDPEFEENHYIYVYAIETDSSAPENAGKPRVIRFTDNDGVGAERTVIIDDLPFTNPQTCAHVGGNLHFGPDGFLYLSIGNNERKESSSDLSTPLGKILRFNKADGSPPPNNPFVNQANVDHRIYAYGFRNPYDFGFHPDTGEIYSPDNGPGNCDELNLVRAGQFYGAPESFPPTETTTCLGLGGVDPLHLFSLPGKQPTDFPSNVAPAGVSFISNSEYEGLATGLLVCEFLTQHLRYIGFEGPRQEEVKETAIVIDTCRFDVAVADDGTIFYSSRSHIVRLLPEHLAGR